MARFLAEVFDMRRAVVIGVALLLGSTASACDGLLGIRVLEDPTGRDSGVSGVDSGGNLGLDDAATGKVRAYGGMRSTAPAPLLEGGILLVAGGFEVEPRTCSDAGVCVTGGIVP
jgi:hypothetical protein